MTTAKDILEFLNTLAPQSMKMEWDNVGLLCGAGDTLVEKVLVALDPFEHVCQEAVDGGYQLLLTHHPLIFHPLAAVTDENAVSRSVMLLCRAGICAINAHTNLDCAPGGVNDVLAETLGLQNIHVIDPEGTDDQGRPWGLLRGGEVTPQPMEDFLALVKDRLHCQGLRYVGNKPVHKVAVGGGACGDYIRAAYDAGCDTFVTSDIGYHKFADARDLGLNLIDAGHFCTENPVCAMLAGKMREKFPHLQVEISQTHGDCINFF